MCPEGVLDVRKRCRLFLKGCGRTLVFVFVAVVGVDCGIGDVTGHACHFLSIMFCTSDYRNISKQK